MPDPILILTAAVFGVPLAILIIGVSLESKGD